MKQKKNHWQMVEEMMNEDICDTPQKLWARAKKYFEYCDDTPIELEKTLLSGKEAGRKVNTSSIRPYNIKALCLHCGITEEYLRDIRQSKDKTSEYYIVVNTILYIIHAQLSEHAIIGEFSPIFTAKLLNIDKDEIPTSAVKILIEGGTPTLATSEAELLEKLDLEKKQIQNGENEKS